MTPDNNTDEISIPGVSVAHEIDGFAHCPSQLVAELITRLDRFSITERAAFADDLARYYRSIDTEHTLHLSEGWEALRAMFMLQIKDRRNGVFQVGFIGSRIRAGDSFWRAGARLVAHVIPQAT